MGGIPVLTVHALFPFLPSIGDDTLALGMNCEWAGAQVRQYALHRNVRIFGAGGYQLCAAVAAVYGSGDFWFLEQHVVHVFGYGYCASMHLGYSYQANPGRKLLLHNRKSFN